MVHFLVLPLRSSIFLCFSKHLSHPRVTICGYVTCVCVCVCVCVCKYQCKHCVQELECFQLKSLCTFINTATLDIWGAIFNMHYLCNQQLIGQHIQVFKAQNKLLLFFQRKFPRESLTLEIIV